MLKIKNPLHRLLFIKRSWHVWNQDNVKRVRDDEQKQQEEEESKRLREKELLNEQILDALKRDNDSVKSGNGPVSEGKAPPEKFSLFDDPSCPVLSHEGRKAIGNAEYRTEAEEKKQREAKRNGVAPWGLADVTHILLIHSIIFIHYLGSCFHNCMRRLQAVSHLGTRRLGHKLFLLVAAERT